MGQGRISQVCDAVVASWSSETMYATKEDPPRKPGDRSRGQCGTTAIVLQDWLGGEVLAAEVWRDGQKVGAHYWNQLPDGTEIDLTAGQFLPNEQVVGRRVTSRPPQADLRRHPGYQPYALLRDRVAELLGPSPRN